MIAKIPYFWQMKLKGAIFIMPEISDIPIDDHNRYAQQVEQQRKEPIQYRDDRQVAGPAQIDVKIPSYPSQIKGFTGEEECHITFSAFAPPLLKLQLALLVFLMRD